jgi:hypothetical protein
MSEVYALTVIHGDELGQEDFDALQVVRRTLLGMMGHGFITSFETHSEDNTTCWSYLPGSEDPSQILAGLCDLIRNIGPDGWTVLWIEAEGKRRERNE